MKKIFLTVLIFVIIGTTSIFANDLQTPKSMKFLSQCSDSSYMYMTVVDLSNNEIVILYYLGGSKNLTLVDVERTGMTYKE